MLPTVCSVATGGGTHLRHLFRSSLPPVATVHTIRENVPLQGLTTMRVGGPARFFSVARNIDDIREGVLFAREKDLPVFVLGGGSNIIVGDKGFLGLVMKSGIGGISYERNGSHVRASVGAGENWDGFVKNTVGKGLWGVENLSAIPGTVGAAPVQNIGAYGAEVRETIASVEVFDTRTMRVRVLDGAECGFGYRDSIFKKAEGKDLIVTRVCFKLSEDGMPRAGYKDVADYCASRKMHITAPSAMRKVVMDIRRRKLPSVKRVGTVGSFFKNPVISKARYEALDYLYPGLPQYPAEGGKVKVPLAWIIDHVCGRKGVGRDGLSLHDTQPLVVVHRGGSSAKEIFEFADEIVRDIKTRTNIDAELEVSFVGTF